MIKNIFLRLNSNSWFEIKRSRTWMGKFSISSTCNWWCKALFICDAEKKKSEIFICSKFEIFPFFVLKNLLLWAGSKVSSSSSEDKAMKIFHLIALTEDKLLTSSTQFHEKSASKSFKLQRNIVIKIGCILHIWYLFKALGCKIHSDVSYVK